MNLFENMKLFIIFEGPVRQNMFENKHTKAYFKCQAKCENVKF